jgi:hypothetical protein
MSRIVVLPMLLLASAVPTWAAKSHFVFEERPGRTYTEGEARWRDALLRASVGGCKERLPRGARLRPRIRDCVVNQVHVTNLSSHLLECRVTIDFPAPDDDGRRRVEHSIHIGPGKERWLATAYGPSMLEPTSFSTSCQVVAAG